MRINRKYIRLLLEGIDADNPDAQVLKQIFGFDHKYFSITNALEQSIAESKLYNAGIDYNPSDFNEFYLLGKTFVYPKMFEDDIYNMSMISMRLQYIEKGEEILEQYDGFDTELKDDFDLTTAFYAVAEIGEHAQYDAWTIDDPDYRKDIRSLFIKPNKISSYLKSINIFPSPKPVKTPRYEKIEVDGIVIQDASYSNHNFKTIHELFENLKKIGVRPDPKYVRAIRFRKIDSLKDDYNAQYYPTIRTIVLNMNSFRPESKWDIHTFVHEYTHAIDKIEQINKLFADAYYMFVKEVYYATGDERLAEYNKNYHILTYEHNGRKFIDTDSHNRAIEKLGYGSIGTYGLKKVDEFMCNLMADYFVYGIEGYKEGLLELCKQVEQYYK